MPLNKPSYCAGTSNSILSPRPLISAIFSYYPRCHPPSSRRPTLLKASALALRLASRFEEGAAMLSLFHDAVLPHGRNQVTICPSVLHYSKISLHLFASAGMVWGVGCGGWLGVCVVAGSSHVSPAVNNLLFCFIELGETASFLSPFPS